MISIESLIAKVFLIIVAIAKIFLNIGDRAFELTAEAAALKIDLA
jgi:hypothetical protein